MKAAQISQYGGPEVIEINEVETPVAGEGQVVVEVHASSINPFDSKIRSGVMKDAIPLSFPATLGGDIAGVVTEIGSGVQDFVVGDEVYGQAAVVAGNSGAFAEYTATSATQIAKKPNNLEFTDAAAVVLVGASAVQALTQHIGLGSGQKIFIHGGAGGIGSVAIQIAKHLGAYVTTSATGDGVEFVKKLGADEVIDYKSTDFSITLSDYDAVFDLVGGEDFAKSFGILKSGGVAVSMVGPNDEERASELGITAIAQFTKVTTDVLDTLRGLLETGVLSPQIDQTFPLDQIAEAFTAKETNDVAGKIAIAIR